MKTKTSKIEETRKCFLFEFELNISHLPFFIMVGTMELATMEQQLSLLEDLQNFTVKAVLRNLFSLQLIKCLYGYVDQFITFKQLLLYVVHDARLAPLSMTPLKRNAIMLLRSTKFHFFCGFIYEYYIRCMRCSISLQWHHRQIVVSPSTIINMVSPSIPSNLISKCTSI